MIEPVTLRAARAGDQTGIARVHAEAWQAAYRGILPAGIVAGFTLGSRQALWRGLFAGSRTPLVEVAALPDGGIAGFVWLRQVAQAKTAFDAEIVAVAVAPARQGRGLGRRLMAAAAARLAGLGAASCYLWVYRDNLAARGFYERLGGRMVDQDVERYEGEELPIVAYAWKPLSDLLAAAGEPRP
ncbi:MAG: GNAT family N-acetyltransferase [Kiloniellales bacterium]